MTPLPTTLCIFLRQWNLLPFLNSWVHVNISQLLFFLKLKTKTKTEKEKVGCLLTFSFLNLPRWELYSTVSFTTRPSFLQPTGAGMKLEEDTTGQQRMGLTSWARLEPAAVGRRGHRRGQQALQSWTQSQEWAVFLDQLALHISPPGGLPHQRAC